MRLLFDTHILIWSLEHHPKLPGAMACLIENNNNMVHVSIATLWEIQIKSSLGKMKLLTGWQIKLEKNEYELLNITPMHVEKLNDLPMHHRDPFDRMLIAQALVENLTLLTLDSDIVKYGCDFIQDSFEQQDADLAKFILLRCK